MTSKSEKQRRKALFANVTKLTREEQEAATRAEEAREKMLRDEELAYQASLMSNKSALLYGKIIGILESYANFVSETNAAHTFLFEVVAKPDSLEEALKTYYENWEQEDAPYLLEEIANPKEALHEKLESWLFPYPNDPSRRRNYMFDLPEDRHSYLVEIVEFMFQVAKPARVWKVDLRPIGWYECAWDDFVLESDKLIFVLHLGVSD